MRIFLASQHPLTEDELIRKLLVVDVYPSDHRIFSTFRAYLDFESQEEGFDALDKVNNAEFFSFGRTEYIRALPALPRTVYKLSILILQGCYLSSWALYAVAKDLQDFVTCYLIGAQAYMLFSRHESALEFQKQNQPKFFSKYNVIIHTEAEQQANSLKLLDPLSQEALAALQRYMCCCFTKYGRMQCCFADYCDLTDAVERLRTLGIRTCSGRPQSERACQIYNLKISTRPEEIYQILNAISPVETIRFPDFLFLDEQKFHVNVVFKGLEGIEKVKTWLGIIAGDLIQEGKEAVVV